MISPDFKGSHQNHNFIWERLAGPASTSWGGHNVAVALDTSFENLVTSNLRPSKNVAQPACIVGLGRLLGVAAQRQSLAERAICPSYLREPARRPQ